MIAHFPEQSAQARNLQILAGHEAFGIREQSLIVLLLVQDAGAGKFVAGEGQFVKHDAVLQMIAQAGNR